MRGVCPRPTVVIERAQGQGEYCHKPDDRDLTSIAMGYVSHTSIIYSIFTRLLRHLYDFLSAVCHALQHHGRQRLGIRVRDAGSTRRYQRLPRQASRMKHPESPGVYYAGLRDIRPHAEPHTPSCRRDGVPSRAVCRYQGDRNGCCARRCGLAGLAGRHLC